MWGILQSPIFLACKVANYIDIVLVDLYPSVKAVPRASHPVT